MAGEVIWSKDALDDRDAIAAFIARDSATQARRFVSEAFDLSDLILSQPLMGRIVPELRQPHVREHFIFSYRLVYEIRGHDVHVLAVIHRRRLLESIDERFSEHLPRDDQRARVGRNVIAVPSFARRPRSLQVKT